MRLSGTAAVSRLRPGSRCASRGASHRGEQGHRPAVGVHRGDLVAARGEHEGPEPQTARHVQHAVTANQLRGVAIDRCEHLHLVSADETSPSCSHFPPLAAVVPCDSATSPQLPNLHLLFHVDMYGAFKGGPTEVLSVITTIFALLLSDFFDTMGTLVGVGSEAGSSTSGDHAFSRSSSSTGRRQSPVAPLGVSSNTSRPSSPRRLSARAPGPVRSLGRDRPRFALALLSDPRSSMSYRPKLLLRVWFSWAFPHDAAGVRARLPARS